LTTLQGGIIGGSPLTCAESIVYGNPAAGKQSASGSSRKRRAFENKRFIYKPSTIPIIYSIRLVCKGIEVLEKSRLLYLGRHLRSGLLYSIYTCGAGIFPGFKLHQTFVQSHPN